MFTGGGAALGIRDYRQGELKGKVVLLRVDHNVVKRGKIIDPFRIESTFCTIFNIIARGGYPVLMTHVGRPRDKKTGQIMIKEDESVHPVVEYLKRRLDIEIFVPEFEIRDTQGLSLEGKGIEELLGKLKNGDVAMVYLPNIRWFKGEEAKDDSRQVFVEQLKRVGEVFINDAFGSWQAHASTYDIAKVLPSYAGSLMIKEVSNLNGVLEPERPFVAIIGGSKYDTKIGPLKALYKRADKVLLGGLMYNAYVAAKYDISIRGVEEEDKILAKELVALEEKEKKLLEPKWLVENQGEDPKDVKRATPVNIEDLGGRKGLGFVLDVMPESLQDPHVKDAILGAKTIFVNAVMGLMPHYPHGSKELYSLICSNKGARLYFGGGDTLQEFRSLCPKEYLEEMENPRTYFFTGGGAVLTALEQGTPFGIKPVEALKV